jgi:hypothetical protein
VPSSKWEQHILCTRLMRQHPEWDDEKVLSEAGMRPLEINIVREARREVQGEVIDSAVRSQRSY